MLFLSALFLILSVGVKKCIANMEGHFKEIKFLILSTSITGQTAV
jgi:hypothetical protein